MSKSHYDIVFVTNLPSFYKINLYNCIAEYRNILVFYTGHADYGRNSDFYKGNPAFEWKKLSSTGRFGMAMELVRELKRISFQELILSGWDHPAMWAAAFSTPRKKNSCVSESSAHESITTGIKAFVKRLYLSRINRAYVSGKSQKKVFENLRFKREYVITKGVGVFNYLPQPPFERREKVCNFLFVGRLIKAKNLQFLISCFNKRPDMNLYIAGFGELYDDLKAIAKENIHFLGAVENKALSKVYRKMDVFVLPSRSEPWGLVVEEALNNGLPVLVSDKVGCAEEIVNGSNGLVFDYDSEQSLMQAIDRISDIDYYNQLRYNISKLDFEEIESQQVQTYIH